MPTTPTGFEELLAHVAMAISYALHPVSTLLGKAGVTDRGLEGLDTALYALIAWLLGSREREGVKKLGLVLAAALAALSLLELALTG